MDTIAHSCSSLLHRDRASAIALQKGIDMLVLPLELEVLAKFFRDGSLHSFQNVCKNTKVCRVVLVILTTLEDAGSDEAGVPSVHVATNDITWMA